MKKINQTEISGIKHNSLQATNTIEYPTDGSSALNPIGIDQAQQQYTFAEGVIDLELKKHNDKENFKLTKEQQSQFISNFKIGIYKQLHKNSLLTNVQLNLLINKE